MNLDQIRADEDAAKRASDQISLHLAADFFNAVGKWVAIRLSDGGSDGVLYDRKQDAVRHQIDEFLCAYLQIQPDGLPLRAARSYLRSVRQLYDAGFRMPDPEPDIVPFLIRGDR